MASGPRAIKTSLGNNTLQRIQRCLQDLSGSAAADRQFRQAGCGVNFLRVINVIFVSIVLYIMTVDCHSLTIDVHGTRLISVMV